ncbi:MLX-interacting protein [Operophtera brumata]|uniref:MLX-interacting protein n=1 Tax=Operophtera brumata TaxID=104452 RepID=A0A0L7LTD4_OPEBR|nr:MLX-interacting protein [Operophtera brumata]
MAQISDMDTVESFSQCSDLAGNMLTDEDYLNFMTDTLFSTITTRGASLADFIQPSLGPLQPNLEDFMDTLEPLQGTPSNTQQMMPMTGQAIKNEQMRMYDNGRMFTQSELQNNMIASQEMMQPFQQINYEQNAPSSMQNVYGKPRLQCVVHSGAAVTDGARDGVATAATGPKQQVYVHCRGAGALGIQGEDAP